MRTIQKALEVKRTELTLWKKIKQKCIEGRRTGVGITAEGDMLAGLGKKVYGTDEALDFSVKVHKTLALEAYQIFSCHWQKIEVHSRSTIQFERRKTQW